MSTKANDTMLLASRHAALDGIESLIHLSDECVTPHHEMNRRARQYALTCDSNVYHNPHTMYSTNTQLLTTSDWQQKQLQQHYAECLEAEVNKFWSQQDQACRLLCDVALQKDLAMLRELETQQRMVLERDTFDSYQMIMLRFWEKKSLIQEISWREKIHVETLRLTIADEQREREVLKAHQEGSAAAVSLMNTFIDTLHRMIHEHNDQTATRAADSSSPALNEPPQRQSLSVMGGENSASCTPSTSSPSQAPLHSHKEDYPFLKELPTIIREAVDSALSAQRQNSHSPASESTTPIAQKSAVVDNSTTQTGFSSFPSTLQREQTLLFDKMQNAYERHTELLLDLFDDKMEWVVDKSISQSGMIWEGLRRNLDVQTAVKEVEIKYLQEEIQRLRSQPQVSPLPLNSTLESAISPSPEYGLADHSPTTLALPSEQMISRVNLSTLPSASIFRNSYEAPYIPFTTRRPKRPPSLSFEELLAEALRLGVRPASEPLTAPTTAAVPTTINIPAPSPVASQQKEKEKARAREREREKKVSRQPQAMAPSSRTSPPTALIVKHFSESLDETSENVEPSPVRGELNVSSSVEMPSRQLRQNPTRNSSQKSGRAATREDAMATENSSRLGTTERAPLKVKQLIKPIRQELSASESDDGATLTLSSAPSLSSVKRKGGGRRASREERDAALEQRAREFADSLIHPEKIGHSSVVEAPPAVSNEKSKLHALTEMLVRKSQQLKSSSSVFKTSSEPQRVSLTRDRTASDLSISSSDITLTSISSARGKPKPSVEAEHEERISSRSAAAQPATRNTTLKRSTEQNKPPPKPVMRQSSFDDDTE
ncbi:unnamed protein product [Phytomonas sp. EM1]|nr:unnamed protein product [Phytomonas sp. EM1]|eukprot:CCW62485.1 unnamed protein product [Phytomonas sp. isolate EM1]